MKKSKKVLWLFLTLSALIIVFFYQYSHQIKSKLQAVQLIEAESYFSTFELDKDAGEVTMVCYLTFCNTSAKEVQFQVSADFRMDQRGGLLRESLLQGLLQDTGSDTLTILPNETMCCYVCFVGEYGGYPHKQDRNLPDKIFIEEKK